MKRILTIIIPLLLIVGCEKETLEYKKDGKYYSSKTNKPYNGLWATLYENGNKKSEGKYTDGEKNGKWTYWFENGKKKSEGKFNRQEEGIWTYWHKNGQKESEGEYKDGEKNGVWKYWYNNGDKKLEAKYIEGQKDGTSTYWSEHGEKESGEYEGGKKNGTWTYWHKNGQKESEGEYKVGEKYGEWTYWFENGKKVSGQLLKFFYGIEDDEQPLVASACDSSSAKNFATNHIKNLYKIASPLKMRSNIAALAWGNANSCSGLNNWTYIGGVFDRYGKFKSIVLTICCRKGGKYYIGNVDVF